MLLDPSSTVTGKLMGKIGTKLVNLMLTSPGEYSFKSPGMRPGVYEFSVWTIGNEENTRVVDTIEYSFYITHFTPNIGSIRGGTYLEITGGGFSEDCPENEVNFGGHRCSVLECSQSGLKCQTSSVFRTHRVNNSASDPFFGPGFAWSQPILEISAGDTVEWSWQAPSYSTGVSYRLVQVEDATSVLETGFSSGEMRTPVGSFSHQFNTPGSYHYWSDYVSSENINFRGTVSFSF